MIIKYWRLAVYLVALCYRVKWIRFAVKTWWTARAHRKWIGEWYRSRVLACCGLYSLGHVSLLWVRTLYQQILEYVWTAVPPSNRGCHPGLVGSTQRARRFGSSVRISFDLAAPYLYGGSGDIVPLQVLRAMIHLCKFCVVIHLRGTHAGNIGVFVSRDVAQVSNEVGKWEEARVGICDWVGRAGENRW